MISHNVATFLDHHQVPASLRSHIAHGAALSATRQWPPKPGCCHNPDIGIARIWSRLDLAQWLRDVPHVFGPHYPGELNRLAHVGARLRTAGEGAQVLWALDLVTADQWVDHTRTALAVSELVSYGPRLSDTVLSPVDAELRQLGWLENTDEANQMCTVNHVRCFETSWHHRESSSTRPRPATPRGIAS